MVRRGPAAIADTIAAVVGSAAPRPTALARAIRIPRGVGSTSRPSRSIVRRGGSEHGLQEPGLADAAWPVHEGGHERRLGGDRGGGEGGEFALPADEHPDRHPSGRKVLIRADSAGATHDLLDWITGQRLSYSIGFTLPDIALDVLDTLPPQAGSRPITPMANHARVPRSSSSPGYST